MKENESRRLMAASLPQWKSRGGFGFGFDTEKAHFSFLQKAIGQECRKRLRLPLFVDLQEVSCMLSAQVVEITRVIHASNSIRFVSVKAERPLPSIT